MTEDIRWIQRLANFQNALSQLKSAVTLSKERGLSDLEKQGLIQAFEYTHELAWNTIKDYFEYQGNTRITGSRDAVREAFKQGLVEDGDTWMDMIVSRNQSSHTYNLKTANNIVINVIDNYFPSFERFNIKMINIKNDNID